MYMYSRWCTSAFAKSELDSQVSKVIQDKIKPLHVKWTDVTLPFGSCTATKPYQWIPILDMRPFLNVQLKDVRKGFLPTARAKPWSIVYTKT
jgi:hypothetical protein